MRRIICWWRGHHEFELNEYGWYGESTPIYLLECRVCGKAKLPDDDPYEK